MYSHLSPELFTTTSDLLARGADYLHIIDRLTYHNPEIQVRLQGYVLDQKLELYPELRAALYHPYSRGTSALRGNKG